MIDSRLDIVAKTVIDAMTCQDRITQQLLAGEAVREWSEFAEEFPATDSLIGMVTTRLHVASSHLGIGDMPAARLSLQLAWNGIKAVQDR